MALALCQTTVDQRGYELVQHGTTAFPIACYHDDLSKDVVPWHWHEELEAAVITEGRALVVAGKEKYIIGPGEGFFINVGVLHGAWGIDGVPCRFHSLVFHPRLVGGSLDSVFYQEYVRPLTENPGLESLHLRPELPGHQTLLDAIEGAWQACVQEPEGYAFAARAALSTLVYGLWRGLPTQAAPPGGRRLWEAERIKAMLTLIHDRFGEELDTAAIAGAAAVSESECLRCFRTTIGTTPIQYLRSYRIDQAARLLRDTADPVSDIAARCGFQDMSYFSRTFRQSRGCTPTAWRRKA